MFHVTIHDWGDPININEQLDELARRASPMDGTSNSLGLASFFFS